MTRTFEVVTSCNLKGWEKYGKRCVETFLQYWPEDVKLTVYTEGFSLAQFEQLGVRAYPLEQIKWLGDFKARNSKDSKKNGAGGPLYNFLFDAVRFSHKVAAYTHAFTQPDCKEIGIWMDADCITHSPVTHEFLESLIPQDAILSWLNRDHQYPECGFLMFNTSHDYTQGLMNDLIFSYDRDQIFELQEQHDSYVLQQMVYQYVRNHNVSVGSLSREAAWTGHPLINGPLGACLDHLKGNSRKDAGRSPMSDIRIKRNERYWIPQ